MINPSSEIRALFAVPDYRRLWAIGAGIGVMRWLELLSLGVFAFQLTGSPQLVALLAMVRMLPHVLLGFLVGVLADYLDKQRMLAATSLLGSVVSAAMAVMAMADLAGYGTVLFAALFSGVLWTTDMPVRRRLLVDAAGIDRMAAALGYDNSTGFATRAIGPVAGGAAYQAFGIEGIFALGACIYFGCFLLAIRLQRTPAPAVPPAEQAEPRPSPLAMLVLPRELLQSRRFLVVLGVTVVFNMWCFPIISMVPVLGEKEFGLSPTGIGMLSACDGIGGTIGALLVGALAGKRALFQLYYFGTLMFLAVLLALGLWLSLGTFVLGLLIIGVASACFSATQYALVYTMSPPKVRGRAAGFLSVFIGTSTIGFYNTGFLFSRFDSIDALKIMALQGLVPILLLGLLWVRAKS